jgi:uncharacterized protein YndB with AHSA1/START domain
VIKTRVSIEIQRPVSEVFTFVTDVRNFPLWFGAIIKESKPETAEPIGAGAKFTQTNHFLGRTFETHFTVTEYESDKLFCVSTTWGPIPFGGCFQFDAANGGTLLTDRHGIDAGGFFGLVGSLLVGRLKQQAESNLANLKRLMEARDDAGTY